MKKDNTTSPMKRWFYWIFPICTTSVCVVLLYFLPYGKYWSEFKAIVLLVIWPASLLYWLISCKRAKPDIDVKNYYIFVLWIFLMVIGADIFSIIVNLLRLEDNTIEEIEIYIGFTVPLFVLLLLSIHQSRKKRRLRKMEQIGEKW